LRFLPLRELRAYVVASAACLARRQFDLADVAGSRGTVVVAERVVVVRYRHDPDTRVTYWRLDEAPQTAVDQHRTVGRAPDEQVRARHQLTA